MKGKWLVYMLFALVLLGFGAGSVGAERLSGSDMRAPRSVLAVQSTGGVGGDFLVSTSDPSQQYPDIAYNTLDSEYLVVWADERSGNFDIYGQFYSAQGIPLRENVAIASGTNTQINPAVAHNDTNDEYLVVWQEWRTPNGYGVYAQRVDPDGNPVGGNLTICAPSNTTPWYPFVTVAYNANANEYLVVWDDYRNSTTTGRDIYGQRVRGSDGVLLGSNIPINTDNGNQAGLGIAYNATANQYLVVWGSGEDIVAQRVAAGGALAGSKWLPGIPGASKQSPAVAWDSVRNEYLIVWSDYYDIYGQRFHADGSTDEDVIGIATAPGGQNFPQVAYDSSARQYLVVWTDGRDWNTSGNDIYGQRVLAGEDGQARLATQGNFAISKAVSIQIVPVVVYGATSHQFLTVWQDQDANQVLGQRVWWPGLLLGHNFAIGAPTGSQEAPAVAYNRDEHEYLVIWSDERGGDFDIYGQRYDQDGLPLGDNFAIATAPGDQTYPDVDYNAVDHEYLVVWEDAGLFGVFGQRVSAHGSLVGGALPLFVETGVRSEPAVVHDVLANQYLVVYTYGGLSEQVYGVLMSGDGHLLKSDIRICEDAGDQDQVDVAFNPSADQFIVIWRSLQNDQGDIYGRLVQPDGSLPGSKFTVSVAADAQSDPAVAWDRDDNEYLVVWRDYRNSGVTGADIYAQRIEATGSGQGSNFRVSTSAGLTNEQYPDVVYINALNRYRVVWQDDRELPTMGWDIRGQWISAAGSVLGAFDDPIFRHFGWQLHPAIAYGRPDDQALVAWQDGRNSVDYDIYGRLGALDTTPPTARFTVDDTFGRAGDVFAFNAWPSNDDVTPRGWLMVRWDLNSDGTWDTSLGFDKYVTRTIVNQGIYTVTLEVWDSTWLTDTVQHRVVVLPAVTQAATLRVALASPPTATLTVSPTFGVVGAAFTCDGSGSAGTGALVARWDWENDGEFDTAFGAALTATHAYTVAGDYTIRMEVQDGATNLSRAALANVTALPGTPVSLTIAPGEVWLVPKETFPFHTTAQDAYGNRMYHSVATWSLTDGQAGTIDASGVFTASTRAETYADAIQAESDGVSDRASVTIFWPYRVRLPLVLRDF